MKTSSLYYLIALIGWHITACSPAAYDQATTPNTDPQEQQHPFLIVKKEQYPALRDRAKTEPWRSIKADAIQRSDAGFEWSSTSNNQNAYGLQDFTGAAALAYILDEQRVQLHADRVRDAILDHYSRLDLSEDRNWGGVVPNLGSFFVAILALDIVHDALTAEEINQCEKAISDQIFILKREGSWADVRRGTHGTWDIYKGARTEPDDAYFEGVMQQITDDGVSPVTIHYAWERVGGGDSRLSKSGYMDVLEFTGIDRRYYNNEKLQRFQRWLFGSSVNAAREMAIIGDMLPTQGLHNDMLHRRVVNFDEEAASYAAWFHEGRPAQGHILTYILPKQALPDPKVPQSQWYHDGGAFFREDDDDANSLHGVLYNIKAQDEWHTHQETNGLALSGLGNRLLVNGGRLGAPTRAAALNNTLTVNGAEHASRLGNGILRGFTTDQLDYAAGDAGPALPDHTHLRSLLLVHGSADARPYFLVLDDVNAKPGEAIHNYFHPANETQVEVLQEHAVYSAKIDHYPTVPGATLGFFFANTPEAVKIEKAPGAIPERYPDYPDHNRLEAVYNSTTDPIATVLFPYKTNETLPDFERINSNNLSGGIIAHSANIQDIILSSSGEEARSYADITVQGKAALLRKNGRDLDFIFIQAGTQFTSNDLELSASAPVDLFLQDGTGAVTSDGSTLTLRGDGVEDLQFEPSVEELQRVSGLLRIKLSPGSFTIQ